MGLQGKETRQDNTIQDDDGRPHHEVHVVAAGYPVPAVGGARDGVDAASVPRERPGELQPPQDARVASKCPVHRIWAPHACPLPRHEAAGASAPLPLSQ